MLPLGVRPNQSGQGNAAGHRRFEAGGCAECMALVAVLLRASETETIGMAPARKRRSNSGSSSNRYAECPLLGVKRTWRLGHVRLGYLCRYTIRPLARS